MIDFYLDDSPLAPTRITVLRVTGESESESETEQNNNKRKKGKRRKRPKGYTFKILIV